VSTPIAYKIMTQAEMEQMQREGVFDGARIDRLDGYIHLSTASQLAETLDKHFDGVEGLMLAAVDLAPLGDRVRWEASRGGQLFPHLYASLAMEWVIAIGPVERLPDGSVRVPG
jgi:uncharacterized protein (DUF952 family)